MGQGRLQRAGIAGLVGWVDHQHWPPARPGRVVQTHPRPAAAGACWTPVRKGLEAFLGELLRCRALETVASGYRRLRIRCRWPVDEEIAAKRIRRAFIEGS